MVALAGLFVVDPLVLTSEWLGKHRCEQKRPSPVQIAEFARVPGPVPRIGRSNQTRRQPWS